MAEEKQKSALETGASAAQAVRGAVKAGKAIAAAAKGAAAGPYGAVAGVLWANRKTVGKVILALVFLLMLPVLFIVMLPSVIFGGLDAEYDTPILNNDAAVMQNIRESEQAVWMILRKSHDQVLLKIQEEIATLGENERGIISDPYGKINFDSTLLLSQYSASKGYQEISVPDLVRTVSAAQSPGMSPPYYSITFPPAWGKRDGAPLLSDAAGGLRSPLNLDTGLTP